jgi:hypothetical protein
VSIPEIAEQVRDAVTTGLTNGQTRAELDDTIRQTLHGLTTADMKAVHAHLADTDQT